MELRAPLMHGEFPDYRNVMPKNVPYAGRVNRETFLETLRPGYSMRKGRVMKLTIDESISDCPLLKVNSRLDTLSLLTAKQSSLCQVSPILCSQITLDA
jgi:hypothetical protein